MNCRRVLLTRLAARCLALFFYERTAPPPTTSPLLENTCIDFADAAELFFVSFALILVVHFLLNFSFFLFLVYLRPGSENAELPSQMFFPLPSLLDVFAFY